MNKGRRIVEIAVVLLTVSFFAYQFFASYYSAITTESAVYFEHSQGVQLNGTIIRSEHLVELSEEGTLHFIVSNGERVAKGGTIAQIYSDDKASAAATRVAQIDEQLSTIEEIEGYNNIAAVDMNVINSKIREHLEEYLYSVSDNNFDGVAEVQSALLTSLTRKQVATGEKTDFTSIKQELNDEKASLVSVMGTPKSECVSTHAGYFVSATDGYEGILSSDDLSVYTPEYMQELKPEKNEENVIGKIVDNYKWYVAATIPLSDSMFYKNGDNVKLSIEAADQTISAVVERVNFSKNSDTAAIILSCTEMSSELASMRTGKMVIVKDEYKGLKVSAQAIRRVNGETGVYVVSGIEIKFVTVEILYSNEEYVICKLNTSDDNKLRLYDQVVVKGRGLYDGKIIY